MKYIFIPQNIGAFLFICENIILWYLFRNVLLKLSRYLSCLVICYKFIFYDNFQFSNFDCLEIQNFYKINRPKK